MCGVKPVEGLGLNVTFSGRKVPKKPAKRWFAYVAFYIRTYWHNDELITTLEISICRPRFIMYL
jgi:hypothetical protein